MATKLTDTFRQGRARPAASPKRARPSGAAGDERGKKRATPTGSKGKARPRTPAKKTEAKAKRELFADENEKARRPKTQTKLAAPPAELAGDQLDAATAVALEELLASEPGALEAFHAAVRECLPVTAKTSGALVARAVASGAASQRLVRRVRAQLLESSRDPACVDVRKLRPRTKCRACGRAGGLLRTACAHCGSLETGPAAAGLTEKQRASLLKRRENAAVRAIKYAHAMGRKEPNEFEYNAGDVAFLVRNAVPRSTGRVSEAADRLVRDFARRYDASEAGVLDEYAEHDHLMGWVEMQHAKLELGLLDAKGELDDARRRAARVLASLSLEDVTRLVPGQLPRGAAPLSEAGYCAACGRFEAMKLGRCPGHAEEGRPECGEPLRRVTCWETVCEAVVWSSVFAELGVPVRAADGRCSVGDVLRILPALRPYGNRRQMGRDSYQLMCYFVTHLVFVLTGWGAARVDVRRALAEEYLFLLTNMSSVVELGDAELVGEFVHTLRLFGADEWAPAMLQGTRFLLKTERRGMFVGADEPYRKRYHAAYCGLIGLAEWTFDSEREFGWHLFKGMPARWRRLVDPDLELPEGCDDGEGSGSESESESEESDSEESDSE